MIELLERVTAGLVAGGGARFILRHGGEGPTDATTAIVLDGSGRPVAVVKVARGKAGREALAGEHASLARLAAAGVAAVPHPIAFEPGPPSDQVGRGGEDAGEAAVLVESHLPGRRIKDLDPADVDRNPACLDGVLHWLVAFHAAPGMSTAGVDAWIDRFVAEPVAAYRKDFACGPAEEALLLSLAPRLRAALGPAAATVAEHGDLSDANVLVDGDTVGVIDWEGALVPALPGADLFHYLTSLAVTRHGIGERAGFERGFVEAFFAPTPRARRGRAAWDAYRSALALPAAAALPLFALAWVRLALKKLDYVAALGGVPGGDGGPRAARIPAPQEQFPLTFFADGRCLNLAITAERAGALALAEPAP